MGSSSSALDVIQESQEYDTPRAGPSHGLSIASNGLVSCQRSRMTDPTICIEEHSPLICLILGSIYCQVYWYLPGTIQDSKFKKSEGTA